jgi:hypothetical protein
MDALLLLLPPEQRPLVRAKSVLLAERARAWVGAIHPQLGTRLCDSLALTVPAIVPTLGHEPLWVLVRYSLWCYLLDELLDAPGADRAELHDVGSSVLAALVGTGGAEHQDPLGRELAEIIAEFRALGRGDALLRRFVDAVADGVAAGLKHAEQSRRIARGEVRPPLAVAYLDVASRHIHYRSFALGLLLVIGEAPSGAMLDRLDLALGSACRAVRLANDLCTVGKDQQEGSLNILSLPTRDGGSVAPRAVQREIRQQVQRHHELLSDVSDLGLNASSEALANSLRIAVGVYSIADLKEEEPWSCHQIPEQRGPASPEPSRSTARSLDSHEIH